MKKIAQFTDLHLDDFLATHYQIQARQHLERALLLARSRGVSAVVLTGDLGEPASHAWLFESVRACGFEFFVIPGNHDRLADFQGLDFATALLQEDGLYYSSTLDGTACLFLDSSAEQIGTRQLQWLERQLLGSDEPLLLFVHHPILDGGTIMDRLYPLRNRDVVRQVLVQSRRPVSIFCGHHHYRDAFETHDHNLHQFLTPALLGQIKPYGEHIEPANDGYIAYREIILEGSQLQTEVVEVGRERI